MRTLFNDNWQFRLKGEEIWATVEIPHDWLIYDTHNLYKSGVGCYRKVFASPLSVEQHEHLQKEQNEQKGQNNQKGHKVILHFDGIYMDSQIFVNGVSVGEWKNGYIACEFDITPYIKPGENEVLVEVNYVSPNSRWYTGAGIYRDCWIQVKNPVHFVSNGIYISPERKDGNQWNVTIQAEVEADANTPYELQHSIAGLDHNPCKDGNILVENPQLWDIDNPVCYILESTLLVDGHVQDVQKNRFGFREVAFSPDGGFQLNGKRVQINGVCQHHDLGALGAAFSKEAQRRQLEILREMGVNAIRTAHNPPSEAFMELADEMGFVVMSELTDIWKRSKTAYDYARFFEEWMEKDVAAWIRRDRNCPSVIMWSVGNEIYDTHADFADGSATMQKLMELVKLHDPKGHAPTTLCSNYMPWENTQACADIIKLIGYNYAEYLYHNHHALHPDWIIYGAETASTVQSRGIYHFPLKKFLLSDDDLQCSALGNSSTSWGAKNSEACITDHRDAPFTMGQFIWTGFDYIGEPTPYHTKNSYLGQVDTAGFPKDSYYIYQSAWTDYKTRPMVHLFPYWDWSPNQPIDVRIASNAPKVELFLNGNSLGKRDICHKTGKELTADYIVPYEKGTLKAIAYDENDKIIAETIRHSFEDVERLVLTHSHYGELTFTEISAVDHNGNPVENATNRVTVKVTNGLLLGLDNGDSTDYDQYKGNSRRLFSGKLLAISKGINGAKPVVEAEIDFADVPIRKIELIRSDDFTITARTYPENATHHELSWRLADASGIDSPLGQLEINKTGKTEVATLIPKGDGEVYIRCQANNGKEHPTLISLLPMSITGYGKPFLDPYSFVSGGLYTLSNVELTNGNERGVATLRDGVSHVGFTDLDFGDFGSNEITLWLFPLQRNDFPIEIWSDMPENGQHLCTVTYDKGSIWNTYQEVTYKLPKRLTGVQTLSFVFKQKVHIKGFQFTKELKAYAKLPFAAHDHIYGDSFRISDKNNGAVEGIGNNVTISFDNMIFSDKIGREASKDGKEVEPNMKAQSINISWRSKLDKNTIRMIFVKDSGKEIVNLLMLTSQEEYGNINLPLDNYLEGEGIVRFIFLPGSDIDLEWFQFE